MSLATIAGLDVIEMKLALPRVGVWHCEATLDVSEADNISIDGSIDLVVGEEQLKLTGHVRDSGFAYETLLVNVIGGIGNMGVEAPAKGYRNATFGTVLKDLLAAAEEFQSDSINQSLLGLNIPRWAVAGGRTVGSALQHLVDEFIVNGAWRFLEGGTLWVGVDKFTESTSELEVLRSAPHQAFLELVTDDSLLLPGQSIASKNPNVSYVSHTIMDGALRSSVYFERPA